MLQNKSSKKIKKKEAYSRTLLFVYKIFSLLTNMWISRNYI